MSEVPLYSRPISNERGTPVPPQKRAALHLNPLRQLPIRRGQPELSIRRGKLDANCSEEEEEEVGVELDDSSSWRCGRDGRASCSCMCTPLDPTVGLSVMSEAPLY